MEKRTLGYQFMQRALQLIMTGSNPYRRALNMILFKLTLQIIA